MGEFILKQHAEKVLNTQLVSPNYWSGLYINVDFFKRFHFISCPSPQIRSEKAVFIECRSSVPTDVQLIVSQDDKF